MPAVMPWWEQASRRMSPVARRLEATIAALLVRSPRTVWLMTAIEQARLRTAPAELVAAGIVGSIAVAAGALAAGIPLAGVGGMAILTAGVPMGLVALLAGRRRAAFAAELPDVLLLLAGTLRAGVPLPAAVEAVAAEADDPVGSELRRLVGETALGRPLPEALGAVGRRMRSDEMAWVGMAVEIHQEGGGNLAEVLDTVARTVVERQRLRREVAALTAEGRISAIVLGVLPVGLAGVIAIVNPRYLASLLENRTGTILLVVAGIGMLVGFVWMRRIVDVEV